VRQFKDIFSGPIEFLVGFGLGFGNVMKSLSGKDGLERGFGISLNFISSSVMQHVFEFKSCFLFSCILLMLSSMYFSVLFSVLLGFSSVFFCFSICFVFYYLVFPLMLSFSFFVPFSSLFLPFSTFSSFRVRVLLSFFFVFLFPEKAWWPGFSNLTCVQSIFSFVMKFSLTLVGQALSKDPCTSPLGGLQLTHYFGFGLSFSLSWRYCPQFLQISHIGHIGSTPYTLAGWGNIV
jgi:hypothetical protein